MLGKLREQNRSKKGFTLVELIVVMVILAILAAMLMPSLTGYIDKAKDKRVIAEVHQVVMAAQTLADEEYAIEDEPNYDSVTLENVAELAEIKGEIVMLAIEKSNGKVGYAEVLRGGVTGYYGANKDTVITSANENVDTEKPEKPTDDDKYYIVSNTDDE